ncbi:MAG: amidohydrolase family protein [Alphaproteobacteria bacterium]|nr:amidohydrolase family protein [Alphaproteobacteria bacterium]
MKPVWLLLPLLMISGPSVPAQESGQVPYIDTHAHLHGVIGQGRSDYEGAARLALQVMDELGIRQTILLPPPFTSGHDVAYDIETLKPVTDKYPGRFRFMAGGGSLSPLLLDAAKNGQVSEETRSRFIAATERVAVSGAVAFGELALEHFGLGPGHQYEYVPPDHPLMLLLADIGAEKDMPLEVHMEAIEREAPAAPRYVAFGNPAIMKPNIDAFERLLAHNPKTRFVWAHMGWDNTGQRTPALMARLLAAHPNLFVNIKMGPDSLPINRPLERGSGLVPEWAQLIATFTDRIMLGSDQFYVTPASPKRFPIHMRPVRDLLDALPRDQAIKVGYENAIRVYRLER